MKHSEPEPLHTRPEPQEVPADTKWVQTPVPLHTSRVQALLSLVQIVPEEANPSAGQLLLLPVQYSVTSQGPVAPRQAVVEDCLASAGQLDEVPVQYSATSHVPAEARHIVLAGLKLQLLVDWLGSHTWQAALGFVVPDA